MHETSTLLRPGRFARREPPSSFWCFLVSLYSHRRSSHYLPKYLCVGLTFVTSFPIDQAQSWLVPEHTTRTTEQPPNHPPSQPGRNGRVGKRHIFGGFQTCIYRSSNLPLIRLGAMAANDYYQSSSQQYQAFNPSAQSNPTTHSQSNYYAEHGQSAPSVAPSYHSNDPYGPESRLSPPPMSNPSHSNTFFDEPPAKNNARIQTEWPATMNTAYPPSPESQQPHPALLPSPTKSKRKKKKGGFFSGKVPWFVYFITLVQVTVFIVEIIKNCRLHFYWSRGSILTIP